MLVGSVSCIGLSEQLRPNLSSISMRCCGFLELEINIDPLKTILLFFMAMIRAGSVGTRSTCEYTYWDSEGGDGEEVMGDDYWDDKGRTLISHIYVAFDEVIMSIQFGFLENGALVLSNRYGGFEDGSNFRVVSFVSVIIIIIFFFFFAFA